MYANLILRLSHCPVLITHNYSMAEAACTSTFHELDPTNQPPHIDTKHDLHWVGGAGWVWLVRLAPDIQSSPFPPLDLLCVLRSCPARGTMLGWL